LHLVFIAILRYKKLFFYAFFLFYSLKTKGGGVMSIDFKEYLFSTIDSVIRNYKTQQAFS
jgi:hypothetical protein